MIEHPRPSKTQVWTINLVPCSVPDVFQSTVYDYVNVSWCHDKSNSLICHGKFIFVLYFNGHKDK